MDSALLLAFCASFFLIAISPGLCMTLALSVGIRVGLRRSLWMMLGELSGVALVGFCVLTGVAALLVQVPEAFRVARFLGAGYLLWMAARTWRAPAGLSAAEGGRDLSATGLLAQGFITAAANPKGWAFCAALLPPFLDRARPLGGQIAILLGAMLAIEFICLVIYAQGGRRLAGYLEHRGLGHWMTRVSAGMLVVVAVWLMVF